MWLPCCVQVSGLKSITAKHLALANQSITLIVALLPSMRQVLGAMLPERRHLLLLCELDRLEQVTPTQTTRVKVIIPSIFRARTRPPARGPLHLTEQGFFC